MRQLAYVSRATDQMSQDDISGLMRKARRKNRDDQITGMLLVEWPVFLQIIEGPENAVDGLLQQLKQDPRHEELTVIYQNDQLEQREFGRWMMSCKILGEDFSKDFAELDVRVKDILRSSTDTTGGIAHQVLLDFRAIERSYLDI